MSNEELREKYIGDKILDIALTEMASNCLILFFESGKTLIVGVKDGKLLVKKHK